MTRVHYVPISGLAALHPLADVVDWMKRNIMGKETTILCNNSGTELSLAWFNNITAYMGNMAATRRSIAQGMNDDLAEIDAVRKIAFVCERNDRGALCLDAPIYSNIVT